MRLIHHILDQPGGDSKIALMTPESGTSLTYAELAEHCTRLATAWRNQSEISGSRIAVLLPNSTEFVIALFACLKLGGIAVPLDIYAKKTEILSILRCINPQLVVTNQGLLRKIKSDLLAEKNVCLLRFAEHRLQIEYSPTSAPDTDRNLTSQKDGPPDDLCHPPAIRPEDDALFIMTSGSTGTPKAVRLNHQAVLNNIRMHLDSLEIDTEIVGLQVLSMNYSYGLIASFLSILYRQGTVVLMSPLDANALIRNIDRFKINFFIGTPTIFRYLCDKATFDSKLRSLRHITIGGDRCTPNLARAIRQNLPFAKAYVTYGVTEAGPRISTLPPEYLTTRHHSVGLPLKGVDVEIVDNAGKTCRPHEVGRIVVRTPCMMNGYFDDPSESVKMLRDGWFYTGDLGSKDTEGFVYFAGREDSSFKIHGKKVAPALIEKCICSHALVQQCRLSKVETESDEYIRATITVQGTFPTTLIGELRKMCRQQLALYMVPREFELDHTGDYYFKGKVDKLLQSRVHEA